MAVVGIDLGTTNTVIAAVRDGRATALKDKLGRALLPSVVSFSMKGEPKVGYPAKDRRTIDPENTIFSIKRLIGRTFDSEHVQKALGRLPFDLKEGPGRSTLVGAHGKDYTLPEISALVLRQAAEIAQTRLGTEVSDAVITVPANFNDLQRAATKVAGRTAGLEVLRIINEPTAAALAYGFGKKGRERIAVYDFGGGTFDVTLLDLSENVFEVLATAGDTFLGGDDLDREIMDRMAEELLEKNKIDASSDNLVREQLRASAEKLKVDLSTRSMAKTRVEDLEFEFTMRRSEFEKLAEPLLKRTLDVCQEAMDVAGISKKDLDQVLLVGGSTRIPLVRRRISSFFGKMPQSRINPDEVVAIGAAIQAASLEAKQGQTNMPAAPRPRAASAHPSRAPAPLGARKPGTTKTGLAGLRKTLAGQGSSDAPGRTTENSVLSGVKTVSPSVGPGPKVNPAKTLAGVGPGRNSSPPVQLGAARKTDPQLGSGRDKMNTLAGVGGETPGRKRSNTLSGLNERKKGTTNLGLGTSPSSPPPSGAEGKLKSSPPPRALASDFDDVTRVQTDPDGEAAAREKQETIPGAAAPPNDGSVTFDLAELEAMDDADTIENEFSSLDEETTQVVDAGLVAANAAVLEQGAKEYENLDLPSPSSRVEELGDSALMSFEEMGLEEEDAGLPMPAADLPAPVSKLPAELSASALTDLDDDDFSEEELDLPMASAGLPATRQDAFAQTAVGLPSPLADLPARAADLPTPAAALPEPSAALPQASAGLPAAPEEHDELDLPLVGAETLSHEAAPIDLDPTEAPKRSESAEHRLGLGSTQVAPGGSSGLDFEGARKRSSEPSVHELDELSVAALLPDDASGAHPLDLDGNDLVGLGNSGTSPGHQAPHQAGYESGVSGSAFIGDAPLDSLAGGSRPTTENAGTAPPSEPSTTPFTGAPLLLDVTPLSLGVEVVGGYVDRLIERNSPVPCEQTRTFATAQDNQSIVRVRVSQGEEGQFNENTVLGEVELTGLSQGPRGSVKVDVSFSLDESGMLQVSATDRATGNAANARLMLAGVSS